jgi:hypothetical protein
MIFCLEIMLNNLLNEIDTVKGRFHYLACSMFKPMQNISTLPKKQLIILILQEVQWTPHKKASLPPATNIRLLQRLTHPKG